MKTVKVLQTGPGRERRISWEVRHRGTHTITEANHPQVARPGICSSPEQLEATALTLAKGQLPPGWEWIASSTSARVARQGQQGIFYKEFLPRSSMERIKTRLRGSRAARARHNSEALLRAGFNAPRSLAWGKLAGGRYYLLSAAVPGEGVTTWLRARMTSRSREALRYRRRLLDELGHFVGKLHRAGFVHGDLRPSNLLAVDTGERFEFALIDNERNRRRRPPGLRGMRKNLMQLNMLLPSDLTRTDRWRFFRAWREEMPVLARAEADSLAIAGYRWAMRRLNAKGKL